MNKLSEIAMDEYICVGGNIERDVMTKEDYLDSDYFIGKKDVKIYKTETWYATIGKYEFEGIINAIHEDGDVYEGWDDDVRDVVLSCPKLKAAIEAINKIFRKYPSYHKGSEIINDMLENPEVS